MPSHSSSNEENGSSSDSDDDNAASENAITFSKSTLLAYTGSDLRSETEGEFCHAVQYVVETAIHQKAGINCKTFPYDKHQTYCVYRE